MGKRENFTAGRVAEFACPAGKQQAIYKDGKQPGLGLRVTANGARAYIFESKCQGRTVRVTIGDPSAWTIDAARKEAARLKMLVDSGVNPVEQRREQAEARARAKAEREAEAQRQTLTVGEAWAAYIEERRPHWSALHFRDHLEKAAPGGQPSKRRGASKGAKTKPGPLAEFMPLPLGKLDAATIEAWAAREGKTRPTSARLAWRLLAVFMTWCSEQPRYAGIVQTPNPAKTRRTREALGKPGTKSDVLTREQLAAWFAHVRQIQNPVIAAALQTMLLTGARPGEVLTMRWEDVNLQWRGMAVRDKVEGERAIPLTPYIAHLLAALPRRNEWVFSSPSAAGGHITTPNTPHARACRAAGLDGLTLHGLRRSFASLTEWLEIPTGVTAQIQGHKPSAVAEKHYKRRPLDLLRLHHEKIEAWILSEAGIDFTPAAMPGLRVVG